MKAALFALCALCALAAHPALAQTAVDVELVIAVDCSASIDDREFALQMAGIAAAFRDPEVVAAIGSGPNKRIAVAATFWAESGLPSDATPWYVVATAEDAERFAQLMDRWPRRVEGGTGIGTALLNGVRQLEYNGIQGKRQIIDISGDGRETTMREFFITSPQARAMARPRRLLPGAGDRRPGLLRHGRPRDRGFRRSHAPQAHPGVRISPPDRPALSL